MGPALGAKQRIIEANRYKLKRSAQRKVRITKGSKAQDTYKKVGDIIIDNQGRKFDVTQEGY